jgi:type II secretory pathway component PulF
MATSDAIQDLGIKDLNRVRGGLGVALAHAVALGLFALNAFFISPSFESMFEDLGTQLPVPVRGAFAIARATRTPVGIGVMAIATVLGLGLYFSNRKGSRLAFRLQLALLVVLALATAYLHFNLLYCLLEIIPASVGKAR